MASITGINSYLYSGSSIGAINNSTEKFKGTVTGYKPIEKTMNGTSASSLTSEDTKAYMTAIKDFGNKLRTATGNLATAGQSVFNKLTGASSKEEALSVSVANQADAGKASNAKAAKNVTIQQLATAQKNTGTTLNATALNGAKTGTNSFVIEKDGKAQSFSVNINKTDSVRTAQQKTADVINKQNVGIAATVEYDDKTKKSTLVLSSKETGEKNAFTIADREEQGNLVAALGIGQTTQVASDARYTVNGVHNTSDKNTVDLGDGLTGTLKKVSADEIEVKAKKDVSGISKTIYDVVNNFNGLREATNDYGNDKGAKALRQRMDSIASSYATSLQNIGITRNKDGYLQVDNDKLEKAFENGSAERFLGDSNAGFTQRLSRLATSVDQNPDQFVSYQSRNNMNGVSASGYSNGGYNNDYVNYLSAYRETQLSNLGLLFNSGV